MSQNMILNFKDLKMKNLLPFTVFITLSLPINAQTVTDIDGNVYDTVNIGIQTWMKENLKTTQYNDETPIPLESDGSKWAGLKTPAYCWIENNETAYKNTYGALYNWYAVNTGKLCPEGWHVSADTDWTTMGNYLIANGYNYNGRTTANEYGKAIASVTGWSSTSIDCAIGSDNYPDKRNATGFTALPGGIRSNDSNIYKIVFYGMFWTSSERDTSFAFDRYLGYDHCGVVRSWRHKENGLSVRCVRNNLVSMTNPPNTDATIFYPNPATEKLYIKNSNDTKAIIMINDIHGKQVSCKQIDSNPIDISNLEKGIYVVKLLNSANVLISIFIKE
jgi:uncharacterized protein (TIGR02145 family)